MRLLTAVAVAGCVTLAAQNVVAQTDDSRFYVSASGALQPGSETYSDDGTFRLYDETGKLNASSTVAAHGGFDFAVAAKVTGNWTVGAGFHRTSGKSDAAVSGTAPHPVFFDRPRAFTAAVPDLHRSEQALHLSVGYMTALTDKVALHVYAGPSQFRFSQDVPASVTIGETGAAFTAVQATTVIATRKDTSWGGHVGLDLSYALFQSGATSFGLGGFVRYAQAASKFQVVSNSANTKIGGVQMGVGLRVRF